MNNHSVQDSLMAGKGICDITRRDVGAIQGDVAIRASLGLDKQEGIRIHDPLFARALVLDNGDTRVAILSMDVIAIGGIYEVPDSFLPEVRARIESELGIPGARVLVNASHTHLVGGQLCDDLVERAADAVRQACAAMRPVTVRAGKGSETRITMNRRIRIKDGSAWTERHANPSPPDHEVAGVGPIDPDVGVLRLDTPDGSPFALVYAFTAHPYCGASGGGVTAELPGFASSVIDRTLGEGFLSLFLQGAAGDITEVRYKDVNHPRNSEPLGMMLALSTLDAWRGAAPCRNTLRVLSETIQVPRRTDIPCRIRELEEEQQRLLDSLAGTSLNFKSFLPLLMKYTLNPEYPSDYAYWYMHQKQMGETDLPTLDAENRANIDKYLRNIYAMEKLARIQTNLRVLREREKINREADSTTLPIEVQVMRVGDFALVTFPGELFVEVGLNIKRASPFKNTFIAAYSNGYVHYAPTKAAVGQGDYEDVNCLMAPEWQELYEHKALELLRRIAEAN
ncbi:MAG: hypothetical protein PHV28_10550 [Kiritimatiellae bacterium]|nr:hypothetical protein [Kiritimatiellia bacterium]